MAGGGGQGSEESKLHRGILGKAREPNQANEAPKTGNGGSHSHHLQEEGRSLRALLEPSRRERGCKERSGPFNPFSSLPSDSC